MRRNHFCVASSWCVSLFLKISFCTQPWDYFFLKLPRFLTTTLMLFNVVLIITRTTAGFVLAVTEIVKISD